MDHTRWHHWGVTLKGPAVTSPHYNTASCLVWRLCSVARSRQATLLSPILMGLQWGAGPLPAPVSRGAPRWSKHTLRLHFASCKPLQPDSLDLKCVKPGKWKTYQVNINDTFRCYPLHFYSEIIHTMFFKDLLLVKFTDDWILTWATYCQSVNFWKRGWLWNWHMALGKCLSLAPDGLDTFLTEVLWQKF